MPLGSELLVLSLLAPVSDFDLAQPYADDALVHVQVRTSSDARLLQELPLDIWNDRLQLGTVTARIDSRDLPRLHSSGLEFTVDPVDLASSVIVEHQRLVSRPVATHGDGSFFVDFRDFEEIQTELEALVTAQPKIAELLEFGTSLEGRPLIGVELTTTTDPDAPVVVINAAQHAREWISTSSAMFVANALVHHEDTPKTSEHIASLLSQVVFVVAPVINPDGYVFSWEEERFWRKNRRGGFGVDTNRNFSVAWGGQGASGNPDANNYRGEGPFSEPETAALRDLLRGYPTLRVHLDIHSFGQLVLYPWGFATDPSPAAEQFAELSVDIAGAMESVHGEVYEPIAAADLYPAAGNALDWSYGELGAYAITLELRPSEAEPHEEGFAPGPDQILPVGAEALASVLTLAEFAIVAGPGTPGDDGAASTTGAGSSSGDAPPPSESEAGTGAGAGTTAANDSTSDASSTGDAGAPATSSSSGEPEPTGASETSSGASEDEEGGCTCGPAPKQRPWGLAIVSFACLTIRRRRRAPTAR